MRSTGADRRSERTRRLLMEALVELLRERRYDAITVQDIIDRADVGRSTFYAHYLDKEDLFVSGFTRMLDALTAHLGADDAPHTLAPLFHHVQQQHQLYRSLLRGGAVDLLYRHGHRHLRARFEGYLAALGLPQPGGPPLPLVADYVAGALLSMLRWWLEHDMPATPEEMGRYFHQLVAPGVAAPAR